VIDAPRRVELEAVGEFVAGHVDGARSTSARLAARERLIRTTAGDAAPRRRAWWVGLSVMTAVAAALVVGWWSLAGRVDTGEADGGPIARTADGEWVQAPARGDATLPVGPGAMLALHDGARGRVSVADDVEVAVVLEAGRLEAEVDPKARRRVAIDAGPYRVAVVGTVFRVDWDPGVGRFAVEVTRGKVEVHAPSSSAPISVDAGRRLIAGSDGALTLGAIESVVPAAAEPDAEVELVPDPPPTLELAPPAKAKPSKIKPSVAVAPAWQELADAGKYAEALAAVEASGFDVALAGLPSASLEQLGDAARLAGKAARAEQVYLAVRKRFPRSPAAARAAFQLGRAASDAKRDPKAAIDWLRTYLDEAPRGSFAKLARGRLIGALVDAGERSAAREAARVYLDSYPDGPHAKIAGALLESP
jgi:TolA-binding protein